MSYDMATSVNVMNMGRKPTLKLIFTLVQPTDTGQPNFAEFHYETIADKIREFSDLEDRTPSVVIEEVGSGIYDLLDTHEGLDVAMAYVLQANSSAPRPIHVVLPDVDREVAESVPWEVVRHPALKFLALQDKCPVARIVRSRSALASNEEVLDGPVRIVAVLGAAGMPTDVELNSLVDALTEWKGHFKATILMAEEDLVTSLNARGDARLKAELTPVTAAELIASISRTEPHLLHLLAHGLAEGGGRVEIATRLSLAGGDPLYLCAREIYRAGSNAWLVTLNACLSAAPDKATPSLASDLMAEGLKAVVAMREPIRYDAACQFTRALYTEIGIAFRTRFTPGRREVVYWGSIITRARSALCSSGTNVGAAEQCKSWTIPVLYLQPEPLVVNVPDNLGAVVDSNRLLHDLAMIAELERQAAAFKGIRPQLVPAIEAKIDEIRTRVLGG